MTDPTVAALQGTFEEMTVSPTPGSPATEMGAEPMPSGKITFQVEICFKDQTSKKSVRIMPTQTMHDFVDKLAKKKYLPVASALGGNQLRSDQITLLHGESAAEQKELPLERWGEALWNNGFRDKEVVVLKIDPNKVAEPVAAGPRQSMQLPEPEAAPKRGFSLMGRLRGSVRPETIVGVSPQVQLDEAHTITGQLFGVPLEVVAGKGVPLMCDYGIPAFLEESLEFIKKNHTETEGIFRLSGSLSAIKELKRKVDAAQAPPFPADVDVHCLTGLIKMYLRELPEPLLTFKLYEGWRAVVECTPGCSLWWC